MKAESTALAVVGSQQLAAPTQAQVLEQSLQVARQHVARDLTDAEFEFFRAVCQRYGLDPIQKQIYALRRKAQENGQWIQKLSIQTGIDGYRLIAERTGERDGCLTEWCGDDGAWVGVWLRKEPPAAARVQVWRRSGSRPYTAVALYAEYVQRSGSGKPTSMWEKMPALMLGKCAEALALRMAFPQELSGIYTTEEMGQAEDDGLPVEVRRWLAVLERVQAPDALQRAEAEMARDLDPKAQPMAIRALLRDAIQKARARFARAAARAAEQEPAKAPPLQVEATTTPAAAAPPAPASRAEEDALVEEEAELLRKESEAAGPGWQGGDEP